jgi:hypothetical protein
MASQLPGVPGDGITLTSLLDALGRDGYHGQFEVLDHGEVRCLTCGRTGSARELRVDGLRRLEGASDPADMMTVRAVVCPWCSARGALVLGYGPAAADAEADVAGSLREPSPTASVPPSLER